MQKLLTLNSIGAKGLNTDVISWDLPPEFITSGKNFRVFANSLRSSGGNELWSTPPAQFFAGHVMHYGSTSSTVWLIFGRDAVYSFDGTSWTDISSIEGYGGLNEDQELLWTACNFGQLAVANNPLHYPEYFSTGGTDMTALPWDAANTWDEAGKSCQVIRSHKTFLFALGMTENGTPNPQAYRWSHPADENALPYTWDETDPSSLAGRAQLGSDGGNIIDGLSLRDSFCIYSENAIDILDFQPSSEFVWRRRELSSTVGLIAKQCLVEVKGTHIFLADGDIVKNDGTTVESIVHNRIRRRLTASINSDYYHRSYAVRNNTLKEIWFCVPEENAEYPNVAYIYNWQDDSWAIRDIPYMFHEEDVAGEYVHVVDSAIAHANFGSQAVAPKTWNDWEGTWDEQTGFWGSRQRTPLDDTIVGVDPITSALYVLDPADGTGGAINSRIERVNFPLEGHRQVTSISRIYPHIEGTLPVKITVGSQDLAGGPVRWRPSQLFTPTKDRKLDVRTTGELHCWRIESVGSGSWIFSGMDIEYALNGVR